MTCRRFCGCALAFQSFPLENFSESANASSNVRADSWIMQTQFLDAQQKVDSYFESSSAYWKSIYIDETLLPRIYQDRQDAALRWIRELGLQANARILDAGCG